jgi:hypothetical protein
VHVDEALSRYVLPDTQALAGVDFESIRRSSFYSRHPEILRLSSLTPSASLIGLDPRQNVRGALVVWRKNPGDALLITGGSFSADLLAPRLRNLGARREVKTDRVLYATSKGSVLFPKDNVAVLGARTAVVPAELVLLRKNTGGVPPALEALLTTLPGTDQIWAVSHEGLPVADWPLREEIRSALENFAGAVVEASFGTEFTDGINLRVDLKCSSEPGTIRVQDALGGALALGKMGQQSDGLLPSVLNAVRVERTGNTVQVRAKIPPDLADRLAALLPKEESR